MPRWVLTRLFLILLALTAACADAAPLQDAPPPETEAARLFRKAAEAWRELQRSIVDVDTTDIWYLQGAPERVDPGRGAEFVARMQPILRDIRESLDSGPPQFPINYEDGWDTLLPHVTQSRSLLMALYMDLNWRMHNGQSAGVGGDVARMFQLGQNLRDDQMIISSLTEVASFHLASTTVDRAMGYGTLSQADAQLLLESIDESASGSFFGLAEAYENESHYSTEWMLGLLDEEGGIERIRNDLVQFQSFSNEMDASLLLSEMTAEDFESAIHLQGIAMDRATEILRMEDLDLAKKEFQRLSDEVKAGVYGPVAATSGALTSNMMQVLVQAAEMMNTARARLEIVAASPDGAKSLRNAAIWYRRAFAQWNRLDGEMRREILEERHEGTEARRHEGLGGQGNLGRALEQAQPILAIILEASEIELCTFEDAFQRRFELWPRGDYLPGMIELGALVERAAANAIAQEDVEAAGPILKAGIVMCDHLAQDRLFESSDAAADIFDAISPHASEWAREAAAEDDRARVAEGLARLDEADPFGHRASIRDLAARVRYNFVERLTGSSGKALFESRLNWRLRDPAVAVEQGEALVTVVREIRQHEWPALGDFLVKITSDAAVQYAAANSHESLAAAEVSIAEALEAPDATPIRPIAEVFLEPMIAAARAAIAADLAFREAQSLLDAAAEAPVGNESHGPR